MSSDVSNSPGAERDLLCRGLSGFLLWCVPWIAFALGFGAPPWLKTILWSTSLAVMGIACLNQGFPMRSGSLPLYGAIFRPLRCYFTRLRCRTSAAWTVCVEVDRRRDNHWRSGPLLHSGTVSRSVSTKRLSGLTNR